MTATDSYRRQHDEMLEIVEQVAGQLNESALSSDGAEDVCNLLKTLAGKLLVHLAAEDKLLYPKMIESGNSDVADTATTFKEEMGGLKGAFEAYYIKWGNVRAIHANTSGFVEETQGLFKTLGERIERENTILYPLADRL